MTSSPASTRRNPLAGQLEDHPAAALWGIRSKKSRRLSRFIATIQVIMRQNMIQSYSMNAVGVEPADFVIAPNVTSFDISEFTRADEMAVIGERTTNESVQQLKAMLSKLDPKVFA
jgi:hypothetical protein